jgi:hydroxypyruvate reductase
LSAPKAQKICLLFGGETSVTVTGNGKGGRHQDMALRVAMLCAERPDSWVFLSDGTDGRDGPTDAAGALVGVRSFSRMLLSGAIPQEIFIVTTATSKDLLMTGATSANVAETQIVLIP